MRNARSVALVAAIIATGCRSGPSPVRAADSDPHGWLSDYEQLKAYTTSSFANFEYRVRAAGIDLRTLDDHTRAALASATSQAAAQEIVRGFVDAFHDAHFRVAVPGRAPAEAGEAAMIPANATWQVACAALGVKPTRPAPIAWATLGDAYHPLPSTIAGLDAGLLQTARDQPPIAVVRIPLFAGTGYPELCQQAWTARAQPTAGCDDACRDDLFHQLDRALLDAIAQRVRALAGAKPRAMLLDVTGNGGGTGMVEGVMRMLTERVLGRSALGFIRQPHWQRQFAETRDDFRAELGKRPDLSPSLRALLERSAARAEAARLDAAHPCDLSSTWHDHRPTFPCSAVGRFDGYLDAGEHPDVSGLETRGHLGADRRNAFAALWNGPLLLLVDGRSASATEQLVATLQDYGGATVVGERTMGIGCGYTNGGTHLELPHLGLAVRAPDCIRYRADGSSESAGVSPTISIDWKSGDDAAARARRVLGSLSTR